MATEQEEIAPSEEELFSQAIGTNTDDTETSSPASEPEAKVEEPPEGKEPVTAEQPAPAEAQSEQPPRDAAQRGLLRDLLDEREKRQNAERQADEFKRQAEEFNRRLVAFEQKLAQPQPKPEPIDAIADPAGALQQAVAQIQSDTDTRFLTMSMAGAEYRHGPEKVQAAFQDLMGDLMGGDRSGYNRIMASHDPGEALMRWHRDRQERREIGPDLNAFVARKREEALNEPDFLAKVQEKLLADPTFLAKAVQAATAQASGSSAAGTRPNTLTRMPPSMVRTPGPAPSSDQPLGAMTEEDLWNEATRPSPRAA